MRKYWFIYPFVICLVIAGTLLGSRTVTVMSEHAPLEDRLCIVLDAGHGLPDGGAVSCTGVAESGINLDITRRLEDLLHLLGYETRMLRTTEDSIYTEGETIAQKKVSDLKQRVKLTNESGNAILLSIHQNHYSDSRYSGAQMFYAGTAGSEDLAKALQSSFVTYLNPGSSRQAKRSESIYLMEHVQCTAVLVECGFLSNPQEEAKLRDADYQKKICCVIAAGLSAYLNP